MKGFVKDIESLAVKNDDFRQVLYTAKNCQLVLMALKPREEIGAEVHKLDQFFRVEEGSGEAVLDGVRMIAEAGGAPVLAHPATRGREAVVEAAREIAAGRGRPSGKREFAHVGDDLAGEVAQALRVVGQGSFHARKCSESPVAVCLTAGNEKPGRSRVFRDST